MSEIGDVVEETVPRMAMPSARRRVADELNTGPASLYAYVSNKDELLGLVHDRVLGEIFGQMRAYYESLPASQLPCTSTWR